MRKEEILYFRNVLALSYQCNPEEIFFSFEKILDEKDEDRDDCLLLTYKMNSFTGDKETKRIIYRTKIPVPESLRQQAEKMRYNYAQQRTIESAPQAATATPTSAPPATPAPSTASAPSAAPTQAPPIVVRPKRSVRRVL